MSKNRALNIGLWIAQVLLALLFFAAGAVKFTTGQAAAVEQGVAWAGRVSPEMILFIGAAELAGAIGLVVPAATRIMPILTPLAAAGLALTMVVAAGWQHLPYGEPIAPNLVLASIAAFVAVGRFKLAPIEARGSSTTDKVPAA